MVSSNAALSQTSDPTGIEFGPDFSAELKGLSTDELQEVATFCVKRSGTCSGNAKTSGACSGNANTARLGNRRY